MGGWNSMKKPNVKGGLKPVNNDAYLLSLFRA